jgi:hypothetical protein
MCQMLPKVEFQAGNHLIIRAYLVPIVSEHLIFDIGRELADSLSVPDVDTCCP